MQPDPTSRFRHFIGVAVRQAGEDLSGLPLGPCQQVCCCGNGQ
ncbi:hypothetical protein [Paenibacillus tengchongensis]|nr:hypothetical protein [Paenibacillus tengchongensis]